MAVAELLGDLWQEDLADFMVFFARVKLHFPKLVQIDQALHSGFLAPGAWLTRSSASLVGFAYV
jgi:hypothetical protein